MRPVEDVPSIKELTANGASVLSTVGPRPILNDLVYVSGEIPRVTAFEVPSALSQDGRNRQIIRRGVRIAAELDGERTVPVWLCGQIIQCSARRDPSSPNSAVKYTFGNYQRR
jgi:hypothetical protein